MSYAFHRARQAFARDVGEKLPWRTLSRKATQMLRGLATAPLYLRQVDVRGAGVRTLGRPRIENEGFMSIGRGTLLRSVNVPVELATGPEGQLRIGEEVTINYGVSIGCLLRVEIGDRCRVGPYVMIVDSHYHDLHDRDRAPLPRSVLIEEDVWLGAKASVLPGVRIGRGAVVGTAAVVTRDVPPLTVVAGVPARPVRTLDRDLFVVPEPQSSRKRPP